MEMTVSPPQWDAGRQTYRLIRQETDRLKEAAEAGTVNAEEKTDSGSGAVTKSENKMQTQTETGDKKEAGIKNGREQSISGADGCF